MTKMTLVIGIVAVVLVGGLLFAGFHVRNSFAHGNGRFVDCIVDKVADKLDLDAGQKERLTQIAEELGTKRKEMKVLHAAAKEEMLDELRKDSIDREVLDAHYSDAKNRFDEMYDLFSTRFVEFHQTLTPEQKEKLVAEVEKHHGRRCGFRHRWNDES